MAHNLRARPRDLRRAAVSSRFLKKFSEFINPQLSLYDEFVCMYDIISCMYVYVCLVESTWYIRVPQMWVIVLRGISVQSLPCHEGLRQKIASIHNCLFACCTTSWWGGGDRRASVMHPVVISTSRVGRLLSTSYFSYVLLLSLGTPVTRVQAGSGLIQFSSSEGSFWVYIALAITSRRARLRQCVHRNSWVEVVESQRAVLGPPCRPLRVGFVPEKRMWPADLSERASSWIASR